MFKKKKKNYKNLFLLIIKTNLDNYLYNINKFTEINTDIEKFIIIIHYRIQNIFFKIRNNVCKLEFINLNDFKILKFFIEKIINKIDKFLELLYKHINENNNTIEFLEEEMINMSNYCFNEIKFLFY